MAFEDLVAWASNLPDWQRDALRRIALSPTLSSQDKEEILQNLYTAHGLGTPDPGRICPSRLTIFPQPERPAQRPCSVL
jgi:hypothetical protein